ncbi:hypothetical protein ABZ883_15680 [Streptomyces sp. NPDC046977]|uniref:hypothetical protein n=1 Tax=Streptomyces sp. NPDC046977 TaxID=3154703 RepID=UPI0034013FEC
MGRRTLAVQLSAAVGMPVAVLGLCLLAGYVHGGALADTGLWSLLFIPAILAVSGVALFWRWERYRHALACGLTVAALATVYHATAVGTDKWALVGWGREVTCTVTAVTSDVVTINEHERTFHNHRLDCPHDEADVATSWVARAQPGQPLAVAYDPSGHFETHPTEDLAHGQLYLWLTIGALGVAVYCGMEEILYET